VRAVQLGPNQTFGERALLGSARRSANVIAKGQVKCLHIGRAVFEEVLGPLQFIINADRKWREKSVQVSLNHTLTKPQGSSPICTESFSLPLAAHTLTRSNSHVRSCMLSPSHSVSRPSLGSHSSDYSLLSRILACSLLPWF
jgi:CRP-like cAMP-binding protein